jgi:predicted RNase H-like nuclease (RuvC/YqgF family)
MPHASLADVVADIELVLSQGQTPDPSEYEVSVLDFYKCLDQARVAQLNAKDEQLKAKDEQLQAKDEQLQAKDEQLSAKDEQLEAKDEQLEAKDERLKVKDNEIAAARLVRGLLLALLSSCAGVPKLTCSAQSRLWRTVS